MLRSSRLTREVSSVFNIKSVAAAEWLALHHGVKLCLDPIWDKQGVKPPVCLESMIVADIVAEEITGVESRDGHVFARAMKTPLGLWYLHSQKEVPPRLDAAPEYDRIKSILRACISDSFIDQVAVRALALYENGSRLP